MIQLSLQALNLYQWGERARGPALFQILRRNTCRMVPPISPHANLLVTLTGVLEILGAIGLFLPRTARAACICLALFLIALFPANIRAAREHLTIAGRRVPTLPVRTAMQLVFIAALIAAAWLR